MATKLEKTLEELGLHGPKAAVYIAALQHGAAKGQDIAAAADLPRTTVHEILESLQRMGMMSFVLKGRARLYSAEPPAKLESVLKEKERKLKAIMPELLSLEVPKGNRPRVRFYEGVAGVKTVFEDTLTVGNKKLLGILSMADLYDIPGKEYMDEYVGRRIKAGIELNVIRSESKEVEQTWFTSKEEDRIVHFAPDGMVFPMTMYLYDNKVGIIGTQKENFGMIIESEDFYQTQKNLFDVLWEQSTVGQPKSLKKDV